MDVIIRLFTPLVLIAEDAFTSARL